MAPVRGHELQLVLLVRPVDRLQGLSLNVLNNSATKRTQLTAALRCPDFTTVVFNASIIIMQYASAAIRQLFLLLYINDISYYYSKERRFLFFYACFVFIPFL